LRSGIQHRCELNISTFKIAAINANTLKKYMIVSAGRNRSTYCEICIVSDQIKRYNTDNTVESLANQDRVKANLGETGAQVNLQVKL